MKKLLFTTILLSAIISCKKESAEKSNSTPQITEITTEIEENAVLYEVNIRQYSEEGTFNAFTKDIPQLKEMGIKIIWVMPIFPISQTKRKATGGDDSKFASEMPKEEQSKYLGSYYAVSDFKKVNPEFGTIEDFRNLVKTAHENGIYVILDWVPNHTGWDHVWIKQHFWIKKNVFGFKNHFVFSFMDEGIAGTKFNAFLKAPVASPLAAALYALFNELK